MSWEVPQLVGVLMPYVIADCLIDVIVDVSTAHNF